MLKKKEERENTKTNIKLLAYDCVKNNTCNPTTW